MRRSRAGRGAVGLLAAPLGRGIARLAPRRALAGGPMRFGARSSRPDPASTSLLEGARLGLSAEWGGARLRRPRNNIGLPARRNKPYLTSRIRAAARSRAPAVVRVATAQ